MSGRDIQKWAVAALAGVILPAVLAWGGLFRWLGAHPWWDIKTALIGAAIGVVLFVVLEWLRPGLSFWVGLLVLVVAILVSSIGKSRFAASFAEDAFAGKLWYFGWIGIAAGLAMLAGQVRHGIRRVLR